MKNYTIPYHKKNIELRIPDRNVLNYVGLSFEKISGNNIEKLNDAITNSKDVNLPDLVKGKRVGLIVEDATRDIPFDDLLKVISEFLTGSEYIKVFLATGTHDGENEDNYSICGMLKKYCERFDVTLDKIIIHNCHSDRFHFAGITPTIKNEVYVNAESKDVDVFVVLSDLKNHYFAGYSNPLKNLLPGICKYDTIERNHALALKNESTFGIHPLHPDEDRRDNPLAQDIWEGYELITAGRPVFVLATITKKRNIIWTEAGLLEDVTPRAILEVDKLMGIKVEPADKMIVSCGGYPNDESIYTAQRALELSKKGVKPDGEILFIAGCSNGLGPEKAVNNFFNPLRQDIPTILDKFKEKYIMYSHKTFKFAQLIQQMNKIYMVSELSSELIESIHLYKAQNAQSVVDGWVSIENDVTINIFTDGNKIVVHAK